MSWSAFAERDDAGDVLRARPASLFVAAALDEGLDREAVADDERADALRSAELVPGDRDEVGGRRMHSEVEPLRRLDRVGVQHRIGRVLAHQRRDGIEWLHDTGLVVDEHHRHDRGARIERLRERVEIDATVGVRADRGDAEPFALEPRGRAEHGLVFDGGRHDAVEPEALPRRAGRAFEREVVGLAPASGEDDLVRGRAERLGHDLPGFLERRLGDAGRTVGARRVAGRFGQERQHRGDCGGSHRGRSRVVQVGGHPAIVGVGFWRTSVPETATNRRAALLSHPTGILQL